MATKKATNAVAQHSVTFKQAKKLAQILSNKPKQQILTLLMKKQGSMTVTEIYNQLKIEQSVASQHLKGLRNSNLVDARRNGRHIYYSINKAGWDNAIEWAKMAADLFI